MVIIPTLWITLRNDCTRTHMGHSNKCWVSLVLLGKHRDAYIGSVGTGGLLKPPDWGWGSWGQVGRPAPAHHPVLLWAFPPTHSSSPKAVLTRIPKAMTFNTHSREKREVKTMLNTLRAFS